MTLYQILNSVNSYIAVSESEIMRYTEEAGLF